jgi:hypothetical protein
MPDRRDHGFYFSACRRYRIVVGGPLSERLAAALDGMTPQTASDGTTILTGEVRDQSHLHGLLNTIFLYGLDLVSLQQLPDP